MMHGFEFDFWMIFPLIFVALYVIDAARGGRWHHQRRWQWGWWMWGLWPMMLILQGLNLMFDAIQAEPGEKRKRKNEERTAHMADFDGAAGDEGTDGFDITCTGRKRRGAGQ